MESKKEDKQYITISPRDFISGPYIKCPKCGKNAFGVLSVHATSYSRRCAECFFPTYQKGERWDCYGLPPLNKKVIYLDQFCISNIAKFLNPQIRPESKNEVSTFWELLFGKLDNLCKLQLIICPDSTSHKDESLLSNFYPSLKRIYQHFSHNVSFYDFESIRGLQILGCLRKTLGDKETQDLDVHCITHGVINAWQDRLLLTVNLKDPDDLIQALKNVREKSAIGLEGVFKRWQGEKDKRFSYWYEQELGGYAGTLPELYVKYIKDYMMISLGLAPFNLNKVLPNEGFSLFSDMEEEFKKYGIEVPEVNKKITEFLNSREFRMLPFNKISSLLYAGVARQAANGRRKLPTQGFSKDVEIISGLLPYCDAMFIDNECRNFLNEQPICNEINYSTKVFSLSNKDELLEYLESIGNSASKEHLQMIKEVYGEDWGKPYWEILKSKSQ